MLDELCVCVPRQTPDQTTWIGEAVKQHLLYMAITRAVRRLWCFVEKLDKSATHALSKLVDHCLQVMSTGSEIPGGQLVIEDSTIPAAWALRCKATSAISEYKVQPEVADAAVDLARREFSSWEGKERRSAMASMPAASTATADESFSFDYASLQRAMNAMHRNQSKPPHRRLIINLAGCLDLSKTSWVLVECTAQRVL